MLNGQLIIKGATVTGANGFISVEGVGNNLVLENCKVEANNNAGRAINVLDGAEVTIGKGCEVTGTGCVVYVNTEVNTPSVLNVEGNILCTEENYAIGTNGSAGNKKSKINVKDGAIVKSLKDSAIFLSSPSEVNVSGGMIWGKDGIYQKSGKVTVTGGQVVGDGNADYKYSGNGSNAMGHGIVCEFTNYPGGLAKVEIQKGTVKALNKDGMGYVKSPKCEDARSLEDLVAANVVIGPKANIVNKQ